MLTERPNTPYNPTMNLQRAFAGGLVLGTAANLFANAIGDKAREQGYESKHLALIALLLIGAFFVISETSRE